MSIRFENGVFHLTNGRVSYMISLAGGKYPLHLYWGKKLRRVEDDLTMRLAGRDANDFNLHETPLDRLPQECPTFGMGDMREGMLHIRQEDGTTALDLQFVSHEVMKGKPVLPGLPSARGEMAETLILTLKDPENGIRVDLLYTIWEDTDTIARSARIYNEGKEAVTLEKALSVCVDFTEADYHLLTLSGGWARERAMELRPLVQGDQGTSTVRGASSVQTSPFMALLSPGTDENRGQVYAMALCYSGSFQGIVQVDQFRAARMMMGIQPFDFSWRIDPGTDFQTPEAYLTWSDQGLNGMSQQFHQLVREHIVSGPYAKTHRPILINNWEATYFDFNEDKLVDIADCARKRGIDLFVLDDGWFGHRDQDNSSLGDWKDDMRKLPGGLRGLSEKIHGSGMKFGLWVEPEMISPDSELYRAHPDWCIHAGDRTRIECRHQLVLDMTRADVRQYVTESISQALERGQVDYVKWDMNRNINMVGSALLPADRMKEFHHRYILGVYEVMRAITERFPRVLFESCAGGGGRFDLGMMCLMPQAWTSDDTDAWMRCRIQYATSLVFPPCCMGAHVSAVPNHQTGRSTPLATRAAVAMGGTYGYELDIRKLPEEELQEIEKLNQRVHAWQDVLLYGSFYRLQSPYQGNESAWMSVSQDGKRAVVTHVFAQSQPNARSDLLKLTGLDPAADYREEISGKTYGGDALMQYGIPVDAPWNDYKAQQFWLERVDR
ncbi:MAG: alpha-galactosidase [Clostridia bacterium]|nr:alpha-galactosidase [Clostridia bacterium]